VPSVGFGTFRLEGKDCEKAVQSALSVGYRHLDTARIYGNEESVGKALNESTVDRKEVFLTSKVWYEDLKAEDIRAQAEASLKALDTDYLDLFLIHWPNPEIPVEESIEALQKLREDELIREFGVSNFPSKLLGRALECGDVFCNQVEYHPFLSQESVLKVGRDAGVLVTAYSPLAQGEAVGYEELESLGRKYDKSSEQIAIRWLIEQDNVVAIPRSSRAEHIESNFDVFDFSLDEEDRQKIGHLRKDLRKISPDFAPEWDND